MASAGSHSPHRPRPTTAATTHTHPYTHTHTHTRSPVGAGGGDSAPNPLTNPTHLSNPPPPTRAAACSSYPLTNPPPTHTYTHIHPCTHPSGVLIGAEGEAPLLARGDPRLRSVPFMVEAPSYAEVGILRRCV